MMSVRDGLRPTPSISTSAPGVPRGEGHPERGAGDVPGTVTGQPWSRWPPAIGDRGARRCTATPNAAKRPLGVVARRGAAR